jgi:hypothetical protein
VSPSPDPTSPLPTPDPTSSPGDGGAGTTTQQGGGTPGGGGLDVAPTVLDGAGIVFDSASIGGLGSFAWAIPGALLSAPLAIILLVVLAQAIAGMILVPVTRRVLRRSETAAGAA